MPPTVARRTRAVAGVLAALAALVGCALPQPSEPGGAPTSVAGTAAAAPPRTATGATGASSSRRAEILEDLQGAVDSAEQYWTAQFAARGATFRPVRRVYAYVPGDGSTCGGRPNVPANAAYCRPNDDIAFDIQWTARAYDALGDAFVYYLVAHEYAHAVQRRLGTSLDYTIEYELQADCYAGAAIGDQIRAGALQVDEGDIDELRAGLRAVADPEGTPWFDPRAHGTAEQRIRYFGLGFDDSLAACP